jgi:hypothetical protein
MHLLHFIVPHIAAYIGSRIVLFFKLFEGYVDNCLQLLELYGSLLEYDFYLGKDRGILSHTHVFLFLW